LTYYPDRYRSPKRSCRHFICIMCRHSVRFPVSCYQSLLHGFSESRRETGFPLDGYISHAPKEHTRQIN